MVRRATLNALRENLVVLFGMVALPQLMRHLRPFHRLNRFIFTFLTTKSVSVQFIFVEYLILPPLLLFSRPLGLPEAAAVEEVGEEEEPQGDEEDYQDGGEGHIAIRFAIPPCLLLQKA